MFLKRLREKSKQKYFNSVITAEDRTIRRGKIHTVGVLLNHEEFNNLDQMRALLKNIGIKDNKVKFITFIDDDKEKPNSWDAFFSPRDFGWKGKIKSVELEQFINTSFDALICYYNANVFELDLTTALSKANFKIGISDREPRLYDLIINIATVYLDVFQKEVVKYLKVLNKI